MRTALSLLRLTRPDSSILVFLSIFLPLLARTSRPQESFIEALPALLIAFCTFIINDIDDIEVDKINHPDRPLPSGKLLLSSVTGVYFVCLASALFTTKLFVPARVAFLYYFLLVLVINYKYITEQLPNFKPFYVACVSIFPILIVVRLLPESDQLYLVAAATFFFVLGRELLLDFLDKKGDRSSFIHDMHQGTLTLLAFTSQVAGLMLLLPLVRENIDVMALAITAIASVFCLRVWLRSEKPRMATAIMKGQMYCGLYFLLR